LGESEFPRQQNCGLCIHHAGTESLYKRNGSMTSTRSRSKRSSRVLVSNTIGSHKRYGSTNHTEEALRHAMILGMLALKICKNENKQFLWTKDCCTHSLRTYKTKILPVVLYVCETWSLTLREEHRLRVIFVVPSTQLIYVVLSYYTFFHNMFRLLLAIFRCGYKYRVPRFWML
jgi:hypothetical protein